MAVNPETGRIERKYVDLSTLTLDGQKVPFVYVNSKIIWRSEEPAFQQMIKELEAAPQPGFFLTSKKGAGEIRTRWCLNRHGVWKSDVFHDSKGILYRDVDAKGIGYTRGHPPVFLSVREPEMQNDMEMRGILHNDVAAEDCLHSEEIAGLGVRIARYAAQIELFELVNQEGSIVPREEIGKKLWINMDSVQPTIGIRAMGTTSRVWDLRISPDTMNAGYVKEIIDDAIALLSLELGQELSPQDYAAWFIETMGKQLGIMHKNNVWTDFMAQIHQGMHNVTLDCRLADTYHYQTPQSVRREYERMAREAKERPELAFIFEDMFPKGLTEEDIKKHNAKGEEKDKWSNIFVAKHFAEGIDKVYPLGALAKEAEARFEKAYASER